MKGGTFSFQWGSGYIAEEVRVENPWDIPTLQLLHFTEGPAAGQVSIRFCHYSYRGNFRRSPLLMSGDDIEAMRSTLKEAPQLRALLARLVMDAD